MTIEIGPFALAAPVLLAPMSGISDPPFRRLVGRFGAGLVYSEMVASQGMVRRSRESLEKACQVPSDRRQGMPWAVQLAGNEPAVMADAARAVADCGADIIDINMGCPVKKVTRGLAGSALMRDLPLAGAILQAVAGAVTVPVTLKMRLGWDDGMRNAPDLARIAEDCGIALLTVHGRTRCQLFGGRADWAAVAAVKAAVSLPVVVNGDIASPAQAQAALAASGADGVMVGRAACGRPWLLRDIADRLAGRVARAAPDGAMREALILEHYDDMLAYYGTSRGVRIARKHLGWWLQDLPEGAALHRELNRMDDPRQVVAALRRHLAPLHEAVAA
ncbi:tRNA dihydrouridine synthase DusB [Marinibaculum pumilum]|uniref:tRNA-dihydrouridine synthase n=1 Tax=Marinibaculum pumilum TaxID=1766165 RepID=A0ABV7KU65_9PROT